MSCLIEVIQPGLMTTVQDLGRQGYQRHGIVVGGALDSLAARVVNMVIGNDPKAAVLEIAQLGPTLRFDSPTLIAWCGAGFMPRVGDEPLPRGRPVLIAAGETVHFGAARSGIRAWLGVAGGFDVPPVLGSRSTYALAGIGGVEGRALKVGDRLHTGSPATVAEAIFKSLNKDHSRAPCWFIDPERLLANPPSEQDSNGVPLRAIQGPEWTWFSAEAQHFFESATWTITTSGDRMGTILDGPVLHLTQPRELISSPIVEGTIQVPQSGKPIVLLVDRQTVGGYPRLACVAAVDVRRFAQLTPGTKLRFQIIAVEEAHQLLLAQEEALQRARLGLLLR